MRKITFNSDSSFKKQKGNSKTFRSRSKEKIQTSYLSNSSLRPKKLKPIKVNWQTKRQKTPS